MGNNQGISGAVKIVLAFCVCLIIFVLFIVNSFFSYSGKAVNFEQNIVDAQKEAQNVLSKCTGEIRAKSKIPKQYEDSYINVIKADQNGRYGNETIQRVTAFMKERNLSYDTSFLKDLSNTFEVCEKSFETKQSLVNSTVSAYKRQLDNPWSGFFYRMNGYPKIDFNKYEMVLHTGIREQFETKTRKSFDE